MIPRRYAERILDEFRLLPPGERTANAFLSLAERIIEEAIAFELEWLAGYLHERARKTGARADVAVDATTRIAPDEPLSLIPPGQLSPQE